MVKRLGLKVMAMDVGGSQASHVARCDGTNAQFREYAYVDAIVVAGTPSATLHRMHVFVMETDSNWDLLCGTGPMVNSLKLSLDAFSSQWPPAGQEWTAGMAEPSRCH
ncbi:hypothetical protein CYMTET_4781 [Cymbomonas tetramitiformis]|uniref:Uncharacterized protein n=1 Tax=Cymbomonas tetramitiformis TaxID=36881 RepID=A0AAE0H0Q2_9CHLO|nr:hypothetical protein CYMTET_4781 [Cymbomonas tetramitiformis]